MEDLTLLTAIGQALVAVYKVSAELDIAERRLPQDGKLRVGRDEAVLDVRVSTVPAVHGEKVVLRLLDPRMTSLSLDRLSFSQRIVAPFRTLLRQPHGILFVTGPTGSGKSTTLYASLVELAGPTVNITTIEDPVEYQLGGINQVQVKQKIGLGFARVLRAVLRQDPDVVLIGEIRDGETAEVAIQAALTGHLVLTTLHTNSAPSTVTRLRDMGVSSRLLGEAMVGALGQRLVRRICDGCRTAYEANDDERALICVADGTPLQLYRGAGCDACHGTGHAGRVPVHELLTVSGGVEQAIIDGAPPASWLQQARRDGYRPLWHDALVKALAGLTTLEEARRVTLVKEL